MENDYVIICENEEYCTSRGTFSGSGYFNLIYDKMYRVGLIVQRIGHTPSKGTMLVRFQLGLPL